MAFARAAACSALLPDGRVLVAGGNSSSGVVNTAELYGSNGTFVLASPMAQARAGAVCVAMPDGRMLVTGGSDGASALASAEVYDPASDTWTSAGAMAVARSGHTATLTPWGAVLIVGGDSNGRVSSAVELFLTNGQFLSAGRLSSPRKDYSLAVLPEHKVLIAGGSDGNSALATIDRFNADDNSITPAGTMLVARTNFAMAPLLDGTVLITGGLGAKGDVLASSEIYDPVKQVTTDGPQLPVSRANHRAYTLPNNGRVILVGGATDGSRALTAIDVYEPWTGQFAKTAPMNTARSGDTSSLLRRGALIVAGGRNGSGYLTSGEVYGFATIETDKDDYPPGTPVTMTGSGWKPGEQVLVQVTAFPLDQHKVEFTGAAVADGTGKIKLAGFQVDKSHLGVHFLTNATGSESRAQTLFSDNDTTAVTSITVTPTGPSSWPVNLQIQGIVSNVTSGVQIPLSPPNVTFLADGAPIGGSGVALDGFGNFNSGASLYGTLAPGGHNIQAGWAAGGSAACGVDTCNGSSYSFNYVVNPLATVISNLGNTNPTVAYGGTSTLSAEVDVNGPGSGTYYPAGILTFSDGTTILTCNLPGVASPNNNCSVGTPTTLSPGIHNFNVIYSGSGQTFGAAPNGGPAVVTVSQAGTTTTLTPSLASPEGYGTAFALTAAVTGAVGTPTGTVTFYDGAIAISSPLQLVGGSATINAPTNLSVGHHPLTARYSGDTNYTSSVNTALDYVITQVATTTAVTPSAASQAFGTPVTFSAVVDDTPSLGPTPTGTVTFYDTNNGNAVIGTVSSPSSTTAHSATFQLTVGNLLCTGCATTTTYAHSIQASYSSASSGNAFAASSNSTTYTVSRATPSYFSITVNPNPVTLGSGITVTVDATRAALAGVMPTGTINIEFQSIPGCIGGCTNYQLVNGVTQARFSSTQLAGVAIPTSVLVSPDYGGDDQYAPLSHNYGTTGYFAALGVNQATTTGSVTSVPITPVYYGSLVTYTANITSPFPGAIGGTAVFKDGGSAIHCVGEVAGAVNVNSGVAQCVPSDVSAASFVAPAQGTHAITVVWTESGAANYASGNTTLSPYSLTVNGETTSVRLTPSIANTTLTNSVTYTAVVNGKPVTPTGTVDFKDVTGSAIPLCSTVALSGGNATCTVTYAGASGEGAGTHLIQAFYNPTNSNFAAGNSAQVTVVINPGTVTISPVTSSAGATPTYGTPTIYSVTLSPAAPTPAFTGVVQFLDNGALLGAVLVCTAGSPTPAPYTGCTAPGVAVYPTSGSGIVPTAGNHNITAQFMGDSNYNPSSPTARLNVAVAKAAPAVTAASDPVLANFGRSFTTPQVTVAGVGRGVTPTGTVSLSSGATAIGSAATLDSGGHVTITAVLPVGIGVNASPQALKYSYSGDSNYLAADTGTTGHITVGTTAITYMVTSATIASFPAGQFPVLGQPIVLTATLAALAGAPTTTSDTIIFTEGATTVCGPVTVSNNVATCTVPNGTNTSPFGVGTHSITLGSFSGDAQYTLASTGNTPLALTVIADPTVTSLSAAPASALPAQSVTFTATVTIPPPGVAALNGVVNFTQDTPTGTTAIAGCSSRTITSGQATCPTSFSGPGAYAIHATYVPADGNTGASTGNLAHTVNKVQPGITLTSSIPGPSPDPVFGQPIAYTVAVDPPSGTSQQPSGQVTFYDGGIQLIGTSVQTLTLQSGAMKASVTVSNSNSNLLTGGTHAITVLYGGDSNFGSITSAILYQTVVQATSTTGGDSTGSPSPVTISFTGGGPVYGQPVTFTGRVTAEYNGRPTGTVTFTDAGTSIPGAVATLVPCTTPAATCNWSTATFTLPSTSPSLPGLSSTILPTPLTALSPHTIGAAYSGDGNFGASTTSSNASQAISGANTTTTVSSLTTTTATYGQSSVLLAAQVVPVSPGAGTRVGTISFYDTAVDTAHKLGTSGAVDATGAAQIQVTALAASGFQTMGSSGSIVGAHYIIAVYNSAAGTPSDPNFNSSTSGLTAYALTIGKATTTTGVVSSVTPSSVYGQAVQFTATVTDAGSFGAPPTGTVTFVDGALTIGTGTLVSAGANSATAILTVPNASGGIALAVGNHSIFAGYGSDANYSSSSTVAGTPLVQTVTKAGTTTGLSTSCSSAQGCVVGQPVTLTAAVTVNAPSANAPIPGTSNTPTGTVQFFNGTTSLGAPASLVTGGSSSIPTYTATLSTTLPQGNLQLTAVYSGDGSFSTSTSAIVTQGINTVAVNVVVVASASPVTYGTPVTFTASVKPVNSVTGVLPPTGQVTFFDGSSGLCTGILLSGGTAVCTTAGPLAVGTHAISVQYTPTQDQTGNVNYQPNVSGAVALVVNKIPTALGLTPSPCSTCYAGQAITFTANVNATPASGVPYASGQAAFYDGSYQTNTNLIGTATLAGGIAYLQPSVNLATGLHQLFAVYTGDDYYVGSQSPLVAMTVNAASTTQIFSSVNPSVVGQTVVFTITVGVTYPSGALGLNGQVQLYDNQTALGSPVSANNGTFTIMVPGLTPGTHNIYATFLANGSFSTSTSSTLTQIVNKAPTLTTLAALPTSSTASQQVVLTAVVAIPAPGAGTPTGTVQFVDTTFNKILGSAPLTMIGGVYTASITTNQLVQSGAPQLLTATYSGDANLAASTSVPQGQTVFGSQITVTSAASYYSSNFAPDSWATAWGSNLSTSTLQSSTTPLPTSLAGSTVAVTDAAGVQRLAPLSFVSIGQINFMIPTNTAFGLATVTVTNAYGAAASSIIVVSPTSPGLFSQDSSGSGLAAGQYIVAHADGTQTNPAQIARYDSTTGQWVPASIVASATDQVYLVLYGTGVRYKPSNGSVTAKVNGQSVTVAYAGPQAQYFGEDQVNLGPLPSFAGAGTVNVQITVNGEPSNTVTVRCQ